MLETSEIFDITEASNEILEAIAVRENKYDDEVFFLKYSQMARSQKGLLGAGEWHELEKMLPDMKDKVNWRSGVVGMVGTASMPLLTVQNRF